jgi:PKD repeat protein
MPIPRRTAVSGFVLALVTASLVACDQIPILGNQKPVASFTATPTSGYDPLSVDLDASASNDPDGSIVAYDWTIGATNLTGATANVVLTEGTHTIVLVVTDDDGATGTTQRSVTVQAAAPDVVDPLPSHLTMAANVDEFDVDAFDVGNIGTMPLTLSLTTDAAWLDVAPTNAVVPASGLQQFVVTATCGPVEETRNGTITIVTNDLDEPSKSVTVELDCTTPPPTAFTVDLIFSGAGFDAGRQAVFQQAANRWAEIITGDLPDIVVTDQDVKDFCGSEFSYAGNVDDVLIFATIEEIDGPGNVVGQAGACATRVGSGTPVLGKMRFDSADVANMEVNGWFLDVILHEMGHVLSINGNSWFNAGYLTFNAATCLSSDVVEFTGPKTVAEWVALGGAGNVPVENNGIAGTACSHWDEETFGNELMTGYIVLDAPLSRLTIASLDDLDYEVNFAAADDYSLPAEAPLRTASTAHLREEILLPRGAFLPDGTPVPFDPAPPVLLDLHLH